MTTEKLVTEVYILSCVACGEGWVKQRRGWISGCSCDCGCRLGSLDFTLEEIKEIKV